MGQRQGRGKFRLPPGSPGNADRRSRGRATQGTRVLGDPLGRVQTATQFENQEGQALSGAGGRRQRQALCRLSLRSGQRREPAHRYLRGRSRQLRADGARRADQDKERDRSDADLPALLPRGHLRLLRHEYRRRQYAGVYARDRCREGRRENLSPAAHAGRQGPGARPHQFLCAVRLDQTLAAGPHATAPGSRAAAKQG